MGDLGYTPLHSGGAPRLRFEPFELDLRSGELWKAGTLLKLGPQPFRILAFLALNPGNVVTRDEIRQHIWGDGTVVDFDQRLNACINQIRSVLGDDPDLPRYVETLPRRGYRWVGPAAVASPDIAPGARDIAPDETPPPSLPAPERRRGAPFGMLALAAVGAAAYLVGVRGAAPTLAWHRLTFQRGEVGGGRFAPSGEVLYGGAWEGGACGVYSVVPGSPDPRRIRDHGCQVVGASPQGEMAFLTDIPRATLARASIAGGPEKELAKGLASADWSGDGADLAVAYFVPGKTQMQIEWPAGHALGGADNPSHLRLSPDGQHLALLEHPVVGDDRGRVVVLDRAGARTVLSREWSSIEGLAWRPDGGEVWFTASDSDEGSALYAVSLAGKQRRLLPPDRHMVLLDVGRDGRALVDRGVLRQEVVFVREGEPPRNLSWLDMSSVTDLSSDGSAMLLNETGSGGGPDYGVYLRPTDGSAPLRLGSGRGTALSPDGRWVMTIPIRQRDRIELLPTGPGQSKTLRDDGIVAYEWALFFPDGRRILFVGKETAGAMRLYVRDIEGGRLRPIAPENVRVQKVRPISPDGKFVAARCADHDYCLYPVGEGEPRPIPGVEGLRPLAWDATGRYLYMKERGQRPPSRVYRLEVATGRREEWKVLAPPDPAGVFAITGVSIAPDGKTYAFDYMRRLSELYVAEGLR